MHFKTGLGKSIGKLILTLAAGLLAVSAQAQKMPVEGKDYVVLKTLQPVEDASKIEVIEFFSYACPHCFEFESHLNAWTKALPADVVVRRVPVAFRPDFAVAQRLFYALEALGKEEALHAKVFEAIHIQHHKLNSVEDAAEFAVKQGIAKDQFMAAYNSFGVQSKARRATQMTAGYRVEGVPMLAIQGQYLTRGDHGKMLATASALIERVRAQKGGGKAAIKPAAK